jgi:hypothetical protein
MYNDINEQDDNKTQPHTPQPDPTISSGAGSYIEKDPDDWKTGSEPKMNAQKSKPTVNPSDESFKEEALPKTGEKVSGSNAEKDPDEWVTGAEPMTGAQKSYLKTLCDEAGESFDENLSKAEASKRIDELQHKTGRGLNNK